MKKRSGPWRRSLPSSKNPLTLVSVRDQVASLADSLASFRINVRQAIGQAIPSPST